MSVTQQDIKLYRSLQNGLGGAIDLTNPVDQVNLLNNIFSEISAQQSEDGLTDYRCLYVVNDSTSENLQSAAVYIEVEPSSPGVYLELGKGQALPNNTEAAIADYETPPVGVIFQRANSVAAGVQIPSLGSSGGYQAFWIKRIIEPRTVPTGTNQFVLTVIGETT